MKCRNCKQDRLILEDGICLVCKNINKGKNEVKSAINPNIHLATEVPSRMGNVRSDNTYLQ